MTNNQLDVFARPWPTWNLQNRLKINLPCHSFFVPFPEEYALMKCSIPASINRLLNTKIVDFLSGTHREVVRTLSGPHQDLNS